MKNNIVFYVIFSGLFSLALFSGLVGCQKALSEKEVKIQTTLNPYKKAPLSAEAEVSVGDGVSTAIDNYWLEVKVNGRKKKDEAGNDIEGISISHVYSNLSKSFKVPVLGLYADYENEVDFIFSQEGKVKFTIQKKIKTEKSGKLVVPVDIFINQLPNSQKLFLVDNLKFAFDTLGEVRWIYTGDSFLNYGKFKNGNLMVMAAKNLRLQYHYEKFFEINMLGQTVKTFDISKYYGHHDVWEIQGGPYRGDLLVGVNEAAPSLREDVGADGVGEEDMILVLDRETREVLKSWDLKKLFFESKPNIHRLPQGKQTHKDDWIHMNSLYYDDRDDSVVFSARHLSAVVKFDFISGSLVWVLTDNAKELWGNKKNSYGQVINDYILRPVEDGRLVKDPQAVDFFPYGQHAAKRIYEGIDSRNISSQKERIILFDNGNYRNFFQTGNAKTFEKYSRAVEYLVNPINMTVEKVWSYDADKKYYTIATGSVDVLNNGNRLLGFMWTSPDKQTPRIIEIDKDDEVVFEALINEGKDFYYQVEKFDLYQGLSGDVSKQ